MELLVLVIGLVALDLLAMHFGYDSRDGIGGAAHGQGSPASRWSESAYDKELAREIREARHRRLAGSQAIDTRREQAHDEFTQQAA